MNGLYKISLIVCTHNPKIEYLTRVLDALKVQSFEEDTWELLIVDNSSSFEWASQIDLSWKKSHSHILLEPKLGLTHARIRGITSAKGNLLVFVDDDNVLDKEFLKIAWETHLNFPSIGVFGGNSIPEFEEKPETWVDPYLKYLALRDVDKDYWSNVISAHEAEPCGAGMCILKDLALSYKRKTQENANLLSLDRRGDSLISGGDTNIVLSVLEDGFGMGMFKDLKLVHIIPERRIQEAYIFRLLEDMRFSHLVLAYNLHRTTLTKENPLLSALKDIFRKVLYNSYTYKAYLANKRAEKRFIQYVKNIGS